jgi:hypothetical protein
LETARHQYRSIDAPPLKPGALGGCEDKDLSVNAKQHTEGGSGCTSNGENATRPFDRAIAASYRAS